jgi:hypothetical protein
MTEQKLLGEKLTKLQNSPESKLEIPCMWRTFIQWGRNRNPPYSSCGGRRVRRPSQPTTYAQSVP